MTTSRIQNVFANRRVTKNNEYFHRTFKWILVLGTNLCPVKFNAKIKNEHQEHTKSSKNTEVYEF